MFILCVEVTRVCVAWNRPGKQNTPGAWPVAFHTTDHHPWPLLLQRESHTIIPDHFCCHVSLTFHITDCHTWPLLLQCESHISHNTSLTFTQFTIIPDCFCYNVSQPFTQLDVIHVRFCHNMSLTFHTTDESHIHTTRCRTWPLLLQREFRFSHNSLSYLITSVTS